MGCEERKQLREAERVAYDSWVQARTQERIATGRDGELSRHLATRAFTKYEAASMTLEEHDQACGCVPNKPRSAAA